MAAISNNGGAERYWRHEPTGTRACLCRNGRLLIFQGRWRFAKTTTLEEIEGDRRWLPDTRPVLSGAVTRTTREALRRDDQHEQRKKP